ncbi:polyprotein [Polygonatum mosaic-associated virus 1]|uniref:Genome polyprotein n=1 Tax=Polygonatum mosaic-associated virus 1 TaxID=3019935 RepID=A0ABY7QHC3_9POTV|nr:polyprotein [Polygonatum mosaic-associated virus 1]
MATIMIGSVAVPLFAPKGVHATVARNCVAASVAIPQKSVQAVAIPQQVKKPVAIPQNLVNSVLSQVNVSVPKYVTPHRRAEPISEFHEPTTPAEELFELYFQRPEIVAQLNRKKFGKMVKQKQRYLIKPATEEQVQAGLEREARLAELEEAFSMGKFEAMFNAGYVNVKNRNKTGSQVKMASPYHKPSVPKRHKKRVVVVAPAPIKKVNVCALIKQVVHICKKTQKPIVFVKGTDSLRATFKNLSRSKVACIRLPHEDGWRRARELHPRKFNAIIHTLKEASTFSKTFTNSEVVRGYSGAILPLCISENLNNNFSEMVVRGRLHGVLIDARAKLGEFTRHKIVHYSEFEREFWKGWKNVFDEFAPNVDHTCGASITNEQCGELVACLFQLMHPCKKVSCALCRQSIIDASKEEYNEMIMTHAQCFDNKVEIFRRRFPSIDKVLDNVYHKTMVNPNMHDIQELTRILQDQRSNQMQAMEKVHQVLIKGNSALPLDFSNATKALLEVARWFQNHLSLVTKGDVSTFRNKASSKAAINTALLCDNQLDKNGNFVWGERGYHSKRFFSNFFEEIIPGDGYAKYVARRSPNATRNLAIGQLIVPFDLVRARNAFEGNSIERLPISDACLSRNNDAFVYTCCCVTTDNGKAIYSDLKNPTKKHLVVGNTGDSKYIDLPSFDEEKMFIAKDGYCYLNIFLAMLINVNESDAKDFTKMVRDRIEPMLGKWPTMQDLATACYMLTVFYPETRTAELPRILVDHKTQTFHVIDSFGSLDTGYHVLKAGTVNQLLPFASKAMQGEMKFYRVGGEPMVAQRHRLEGILIKSIYKPKLLQQLIEDDPYVLFLSLTSPRILVTLYNTGGIDRALEYWVNRETNVCTLFSMLAFVTQRVSRAHLLQEQMASIGDCAAQMMEVIKHCQGEQIALIEVKLMLENFANRLLVDAQLRENGFATFNTCLYDLREKMYSDSLDRAWHELTLLEKSFSMYTWYKQRKFSSDVLTETKSHKAENKFAISFGWLREKTRARYDGVKQRTELALVKGQRYIKRKVVNNVLKCLKKCFGDIFYFVNVLLVVSLLASIVGFMRTHFDEVRKNKETILMLESERKSNEIYNIYKLMKLANKETPTQQDLYENLQSNHPHLLNHYKSCLNQEKEVVYQAKTASELNFEKIIAFMALITMIADTERSDAVFRTLGKVKTIFGTIGEPVQYQSLDEIQTVLEEKKETVDFSLDTDQISERITMDTRFQDWWKHQLEQNRVVSHYRMSGQFVEFTRPTTANVCLMIHASTEKEFLVRGAVGSGKSTGLPHFLAKKGRVLIIEPTRPLGENVCKQLRKEPFFDNATLRMRGLSTFGSSNITIMTSGFALHYYAHNQTQINDYSFVIIDECHVMDAAAMAFYSLLQEFEFNGKILKVSATPPGRKCEFNTQYPVELRIEEDMSFSSFVTGLGTGCNSDVTKDGDNILVYVASYNDVDMLSKMLMEKGYMVTKIDGRTMKMGNVEIRSKGSAASKHFLVATNIIENGVTLDVDVVVDFGLKVVAELDCDQRCMRYTKTPVSFGERIQRLGRVGRVKAGTALRIGHTEKGVVEIPVSIAAEAAFLCFAYGLPVMTHNVTTSLLSKCTVKQARTMMQFDLPPFFMADLVSYNGTMHPLIHEALKQFKLRDSEVLLSKLAIPNGCIARWISVLEYSRMGIRINTTDSVKIPFHANGIPERVYDNLWRIVPENKHDAGFGRLSSANACKIAYTLSTEPTALPKTIGIIDHLISEEMQKKAHFESLVSSLNTHSFSLTGIVNRVRSRYMQDSTTHNITILQTVRAQLLEFSTATHDFERSHLLMPYGFLDTVQYQGIDEVSKRLELKGRWNSSLISKDILVTGLVAAGCVWMAWDYFRACSKEVVTYQGKKRMHQKLKFRDARDRKVGREVYADDGTIEHMFGEAYTKRGKVKGNNKTKGMGTKTRNFVHLYGFDPTEYSFVRFVDPITGATIDDNVHTDLSLIQSEIGELRQKALETDDELYDLVRNKPGIQAYFVNQKAAKALKVDLTPHKPLAMGRVSASIAGYPEREFELRQTGAPSVVSIKDVPTEKAEPVTLESKSLLRGVRNYNPVANCICQLTNESDGRKETVYGVGYGSVIIANSHLFQRNNGTLTVRTYMGVFKIPNTTQIQVHHLKGRDMIVMRTPHDFPPFPQRLKFRSPDAGEKCCMVGSCFQQKSISSCISETTVVMPTEGSFFWKHWVSTVDGDCGSPFVSTKDGAVVGIHNLTGNTSGRNYFVSFPDDFYEEVLSKLDTIEWRRHWRHNANLVVWGGLVLEENQPSKTIFNAAKLVHDIDELPLDFVRTQGEDGKWIYKSLSDNLQAVAYTESHLVTKHVVKGRCPFFQEYLNTHPDAAEFFKPLTGAYGPSKLNREAFKKDFFKYNTLIETGVVQHDVFQQAVASVINLLDRIGFQRCNYVTDTDEIFNSLNLKASVGALYAGKKNAYLEGMDEEQKDMLLAASCLRLFEGKMGVWNGSLKAELRAQEKLEQNKTRTFTAAPIDTLLGGKVCVDDFNNEFYSLNLVGPWTVGMTKFYGGWDKLLRKLPDGWLYCHADGSRFDSSLTPYLINAIITVRDHFMEDWAIGRTMLENFYTEVIYTPILTPDGTIVKKFKGNNSGQPSTVVDNTLMVVIAMYYSCKKVGLSDEIIESSMVFFANGDDLIIALEPDRAGLLDTLSASFAELGLAYDFSERSFDRSDLWFMSHKGVLHGDVYIPKLEQERVVSILEWDRSNEIAHRAEAICAAMIEAWGYPELLLEIRRFYQWLLEKDEFGDLVANGFFPYIAETALRQLYLGVTASQQEIERYWIEMLRESDEQLEVVTYQADRSEVDAGGGESRKKKDKAPTESSKNQDRDKDVDVGSRGMVVPRLNRITQKMKLPRVGQQVILNVDHLLGYKPDQLDLYNTRATHLQFQSWYNAIKEELDVTDDQMKILMNGFMVWCIENGTSPNITGVWVMMDGEEQVEYPLKVMVENAKPTLRQIMHHFSDAAEAYIELRNTERAYMPRYGLVRNLRDSSLARYAFDFYEMNSKTPIRAREAHLQMKAAALSNTSSKLFGLDGNAAVQEENTERHVVADVNSNMHTLMGVRHM